MIYSIYVKDLDKKQSCVKLSLLLCSLIIERNMAAKILLQIWKSWKQDFILFMADTKYDEKPDNVKSGLLLHSTGKAREVQS